MDFFALVGGHPPAVYRLDLQQDLQNRLDQMFVDHSEQLLNPDLVAVPFERENFHPDDSEILEINPFDLPDLIFDPIENAIGWPVLPNDPDVLSRVYCIFAHDDGSDRVIFQVINKAQRLNTSAINIILRGNVFSRLEEPGLMLANACHAVYQNNALRFKSIWWLKQIFDIGDYYRAATEADVDAFSRLKNVSVENLDALKNRSGQWVRTRLAYIVDSGVLEQCPPERLVEKAAEFNVDLQCVNENGRQKLLIPEAPRQLRKVLKFLEEEYYAGPITGAAYEANSKRRRGQD
ncbi:DUF4868 domain-containing protein [Pandoraea pnomenusa]|uniref:Kiwa anti-phage protein KwaB-like domain-containing protein n=1 Tax=Pandoraea pnomenusa TaxID=93220 RepID=UPI001198521C|nr:Kiwa anti-phage protein KwaB-like domain-containing protein [Pandoraea pnomenusa]QDX21433.1 DUF4868 domain-containing protein [Pandoraea pnomenusa]